MKSLLSNSQTLTGRRAARLVVVLLVGFTLAASITVGLRSVRAGSLSKFGINEQSRVGKLIDKIVPRAFRKALPVVSMATLTVTTNADSGAGSLRQAILDAASGDTINIQAGVGTISLTTVGDYSYGPSALLIDKTLTINGNGGVIERNAGVTRLRLFYVSPSGNLTLNNVTLQNGKSMGGNGPGGGGGGGGAAGLGGAIFNRGTLTINGSTLTGNQAVGGNGGSGSGDGGSGGGGLGGNGGGKCGYAGGGGGGNSGDGTIVFDGGSCSPGGNGGPLAGGGGQNGTAGGGSGNRAG